MSSKKETQNSPKEPTENKKKPKGFTEDERAAMKERANELKAEGRAKSLKENGERDVLEKIAEMQEPDQAMAKRIHEIITTSVPELWPKTWYGMPAYAKDGKVVCFFQNSLKFKVRYSTLGFSDQANLDEGSMWPTSFAVKELTDLVEKRIIALVKKAAN